MSCITQSKTGKHMSTHDRSVFSMWGNYWWIIQRWFAPKTAVPKGLPLLPTLSSQYVPGPPWLGSGDAIRSVNQKSLPGRTGHNPCHWLCCANTPKRLCRQLPQGIIRSWRSQWNRLWTVATQKWLLAAAVPWPTKSHDQPVDCDPQLGKYCSKATKKDFEEFTPLNIIGRKFIKSRFPHTFIHNTEIQGHPIRLVESG